MALYPTRSFGTPRGRFTTQFVAGARRSSRPTLIAAKVTLAAILLTAPSVLDAAAAELLEEQGVAVRPRQLAPERDPVLAGLVPPPPERADVFAKVGRASLVEPSPKPMLVGFHQSNGSSPLPLRPVKGASHRILDGRGRGTHPTSAVDIVLEAGEPVRAPVDGVVVTANPYSLYGRTTDVLIVIEPDDEPDMVVRLLHVKAAKVEPGDRVKAGETVVAAGARLLPFGSQVDRVLGRRVAHVHIEVHRG